MDISDGLAISLYDIAAESGVGMEICSNNIPLPPHADQEKAYEAALYGGGDFELLFFMPEEYMQNLSIQTTTIGRVTKNKEILMDGLVLQKKGYLHHW